MSNVFYGQKHMKHFCTYIIHELHLQDLVINKQQTFYLKCNYFHRS